MLNSYMSVRAENQEYMVTFDLNHFLKNVVEGGRFVHLQMYDSGRLPTNCTYLIQILKYRVNVKSESTRAFPSSAHIELFEMNSARMAVKQY